MKLLFTVLMCIFFFDETAQAQSSTKEEPISSPIELMAETQKDQSENEVKQENLQMDIPAIVEVSGTKDPEMKPYRTMIKGLDV